VKQHAVGFLPDLFRLIQGVSNAPESTLIQTGASPHRKTASKDGANKNTKVNHRYFNIKSRVVRLFDVRVGAFVGVPCGEARSGAPSRPDAGAGGGNAAGSCPNLRTVNCSV